MRRRQEKTDHVGLRKPQSAHVRLAVSLRMDESTRLFRSFCSSLTFFLLLNALMILVDLRSEVPRRDLGPEAYG